ncbi:MAG: hypothetical protein INR71_15385, partial [Terriglobus roseus]|nr:hypothetical protein [Terriglobus roseus]
MDAADRGSRRQTPFNEGPPPPARDLDWGARKGPLSPLPQQERPARDPARMRSNEGQTPTERRNSPAWGEGTNRSQDGSRPPRGDRPPVERVPTQAEKDNQWRSRMKPDAQKSPTPTPDPSVPSSPAQPPPPATRPKLNLQKRTVSEAEPSPVNATTPGDSKASPFGAARPIDTSAREKEVEEKRQLALRQKKEADEKARAERKVQQEKERAEKIAAARDAVPEENGEPAAEGDDEEKPKRSNFEILRRQTEENGENGDVEEEEDPEGVDASANGTIVDDKAVKPKEVTRDPPTGPRGTWRKG